MTNLIEQIDRNAVPRHVAIIMDGNGRWAKAKGEDRIYGHMNGVESVRNALKASRDVGVEYLTLYAFSSENWSRPKEEVDALMELFIKTTIKEIDELHENKIRLRAIGDLQMLPGDCFKVLKEAIEKTKKNTGANLILALSYGARNELISAVKNIAEKVKSGEINVDQISEKMFGEHLYTKDIPDPDLLIRTSGEQRLSNFLLWQCAYTEFSFIDVMWPDFTKENFIQAVIDYQKRERRFGKTSSQITPSIS